jgi:hypothetical protein
MHTPLNKSLDGSYCYTLTINDADMLLFQFLGLFIYTWVLDATGTGCAGFEGFKHNDERKESKSVAEHSEGDKKTKMALSRKKAINTGNKFRHSLRRHFGSG